MNKRNREQQQQRRNPSELCLNRDLVDLDVSLTLEECESVRSCL